jgi:hypothetical protein
MHRRTLSLAGLLVALVSVAASAQERVVGSESRTGKCGGAGEPSIVWDGVATDLEATPKLVGPAQLPAYPKSMYRDNYVGRILLSFVIDTAGAVVPGTVQVVESNDQAFSEWGCSVANRLRYAPVKRGGRSVSALVPQPFTFAAHVAGRRPM